MGKLWVDPDGQLRSSPMKVKAVPVADIPVARSNIAVYMIVAFILMYFQL